MEEIEYFQEQGFEILRCDIPVVYKLQCRKGVNGCHKHNKFLVK